MHATAWVMFAAVVAAEGPADGLQQAMAGHQARFSACGDRFIPLQDSATTEDGVARLRVFGRPQRTG